MRLTVVIIGSYISDPDPLMFLALAATTSRTHAPALFDMMYYYRSREATIHVKFHVSRLSQQHAVYTELTTAYAVAILCPVRSPPRDTLLCSQRPHGTATRQAAKTRQNSMAAFSASTIHDLSVRVTVLLVRVPDFDSPYRNG